jgi:hypothetical protein
LTRGKYYGKIRMLKYFYYLIVYYLFYLNIFGRRKDMPEIKYEVVDKIGIVSEGNNGWNKELNLISWNEREPVYDIRTWSPDHEKMGKGVTITVEEAKTLRDMLNKLNLD